MITVLVLVVTSKRVPSERIPQPKFTHSKNNPREKRNCDSVF
jgi:hypothetical protein